MWRQCQQSLLLRCPRTWSTAAAANYGNPKKPFLKEQGTTCPPKQPSDSGKHPKWWGLRVAHSMRRRACTAWYRSLSTLCSVTKPISPSLAAGWRPHLQK
uniref:Putative secreted protein n=1 Tax=Amblyomma parvum TaxID=251391 RepID=A0A023G018_AMBPA